MDEVYYFTTPLVALNSGLKARKFGSVFAGKVQKGTS